MSEQRLDEIDKRMDRVEDRQDRLEEAHKRHEIEFAETKVYVKEIYKKMDWISVTLESLKNSTNDTKQNHANKWEQFFEKGFWLVIGALAAIIATKLNLK